MAWGGRSWSSWCEVGEVGPLDEEGGAGVGVEAGDGRDPAHGARTEMIVNVAGDRADQAGRITRCVMVSA
jgi:hypothetical protein